MSKILVFDNRQDFLRVIESLQTEYNKNREDKANKGGVLNE